jgi:hypothetical protein
MQMATCLEKLSRANRWRIRVGSKLSLHNPAVEAFLASEDTAGWNGSFIVPLGGQLWHVRISDGWGWRHLSVTNAQRPTTVPSWEIMCRLKDLFFGDDAWVVQFHPAKEDYVNDHPGCLHLWEPLNETLPKPPVVVV